MINIEINQRIAAPSAKVREALLEHQQLNRFFNAEFKLIKQENSNEISGGVGAVRQINIGKISFKEQIIEANEQHICYRIIGKSPVSQHQGDIYLTPVNSDSQTEVVQADSHHKESNSHTQLSYKIKFIGPSWLPNFMLKFIVSRDIEKAMVKLAEHFA